MTAPVSSRHIADLIAARDSSLPLAAAALARVADDAGRATFSDLAIAYREEFLTLRAHAHEAGLPELGGLSVEEFRTNLRTSVLPRLALMTVVTYGAAGLGDATPVAFTVEAWGEIAADRAASADRLLDAHKSRSEHADDRDRNIVDGHRRPDNVPAAAEPRHPVLVADHGDGRCGRPVVVRRDRAALGCRCCPGSCQRHRIREIPPDWRSFRSRSGRQFWA